MRLKKNSLAPLAALLIVVLWLFGPARAGSQLAADEKQQIVDDARRLHEITKIHLSYASFLCTLTARAQVLAATCPGIKADVLSKPDADAATADLYRNAAVAAQQAFAVVIEKSADWPAAKLRPLLDGGRQKLAELEGFRAKTPRAIIVDVIGESSPEQTAEVATGQWSGFDKAPKGK